MNEKKQINNNKEYIDSIINGVLPKLKELFKKVDIKYNGLITESLELKHMVAVELLKEIENIEEELFKKYNETIFVFFELKNGIVYLHFVVFHDSLILEETISFLTTDINGCSEHFIY